MVSVLSSDKKTALRACFPFYGSAFRVSILIGFIARLELASFCADCPPVIGRFEAKSPTVRIRPNPGRVSWWIKSTLGIINMRGKIERGTTVLT